MMVLDFRQLAESTLNGMLRQELTAFLGREVYDRSSTEKNHRNGYYDRKFAVKNLGELNVKVPRARNSEFETKVLEKYQRYDHRLKRDVCMMFLSGCSTVHRHCAPQFRQKLPKAQGSNPWQKCTEKSLFNR